LIRVNLVIKATLETSRTLLREVFTLRARRVVGVRVAGRLDWIRETGARVRMLESVENDLLPRRQAWDDITDPVDPGLVTVMLEWAWAQQELQAAVKDAFRLEDGASTDSVRQSFFDLVTSWLAGSPFVDIATRSQLAIDDMLDVHVSAVTFALQTLLEQAVSLLEKLVGSQGRTVSNAIVQFPEHLRFGVPTIVGRALAARGVRHRRAAVELGSFLSRAQALAEERTVLFPMARQVLLEDPDAWKARLGGLVFDTTLRDLI
jgi:helicase